jgi:hypothetical protein
MLLYVESCGMCVWKHAETFCGSTRANKQTLNRKKSKQENPTGFTPDIIGRGSLEMKGLGCGH